MFSSLFLHHCFFWTLLCNIRSKLNLSPVGEKYVGEKMWQMFQAGLWEDSFVSSLPSPCGDTSFSLHTMNLLIPYLIWVHVRRPFSQIPSLSPCNSMKLKLAPCHPSDFWSWEESCWHLTRVSNSCQAYLGHLGNGPQNWISSLSGNFGVHNDQGASPKGL